MLKQLIDLIVLPALALSLYASTAAAQDAQAVLKRAALILGSDNVKTLRFTATGSGASYGQAYSPGGAWPKITLSSYVRELDYDNAFTSERVVRARAEPKGGGALPLTGTASFGAVASGDRAWNLVNQMPVPRQPALSGRLHDLWITPHGILKAAALAQTRLAFRQFEGRNFAAVSFAMPGVMNATAFIGESFLVERVESTVFDAVLGDTNVITTYAAYREFNGINFPTRIAQTQAGYPTLDLNVSEVQVNLTLNPSVPENIARVSGERVVVEKAADGVWFLAGGSHNSVAIECADHMVLVEAPLGDERARAVITQAKQLVAGKPLRYVINSHHHFDHAGGLRAAAADGLTLVTQARSKPYFERAFTNLNRIAPDALSHAGRKVRILPVADKLTLRDSRCAIEIHQLDEPLHVNTMLLVYLPNEKLLIEADAFTPLAPNAPAPNPPNAYHLNLVKQIERLGLSVERVLPLHGRMVPYAELLRMTGR